MTIWNRLMRLFGAYRPDCVYWVYLREINVPEDYLKTRIGEKKWQQKLNYWQETGEFESPILLDRDFKLIDGYSSFKIAKVNDLQKVPVYFIEG